MRINHQPAIILHTRPYRETSLLLDVFTHDHGRISLLSRGVRKNRSPLKALLQPFNPLLVSWQGKTELMTLISVEAAGLPWQLRGNSLLSGFYLNELLLRLLPKQDSHPKLYTVYQQTLVELQAETLQQKHLRLFEKQLLEELGYGLQLGQDILSGQSVAKDKKYRFIAEQGFTIIDSEEDITTPSQLIFTGKSLLALLEEQLDDIECLREIKRLMRILFAPLLGDRPLFSRKLFE